MSSEEIPVTFGQSKDPEYHLKSNDDGGENHLEDPVKLIALSPTDSDDISRCGFLISVLAPDVVQGYLQYDLHEGDEQAEYHPNIDHLDIGGFR